MGFKLANGEKMKTIRVSDKVAQKHGGFSDYAEKHKSDKKGMFGSSIIKVPKSEFKTTKSDIFKSSEGPSTAKEFRQEKQRPVKKSLGALGFAAFTQAIKAR